MMEEILLSRITATYECQDEHFTLGNQRYTRQQYSHLYYQRLLQLRIPLKEKCKLLWPSLQVKTVLEVDQGMECVVMGTLYKQMKLKPSILDEYSKERSIVPPVKASNFVSEDDFLVLEDEGGRMRLTGDCLNPGNFVTGVVLAVRGKEHENGEFGVEEIVVPGLPGNQLKIERHPQDHPRFVALVSGLHVGSNLSNPLTNQLLIDHLGGHLGGSEAQAMSASIVRLVIAGNSMDLAEHRDLLAAQTMDPAGLKSLSARLTDLDMSISQLTSALPVDMMPGPSDPANFALPQQALHPCLFPGAGQYDSLLLATNPHKFVVDGVRFLGTAGQNIDDLRQFSASGETAELMERTLRWQHLSPTAPDTLGCYPFVDRDPFVISECPDVYFCGNQAKYSSRLVEEGGLRVRLVAIPRFAETGEAVLVNLGSLECHLVTISL